jgi:hypothetical protein
MKFPLGFLCFFPLVGSKGKEMHISKYAFFFPLVTPLPVEIPDSPNSTDFPLQ